MAKRELILQSQIAEYIRLQYPRVLFNSDLSGIRLTIGQATQVKKLRSGRGWPDIFIAEPRGECAGFFLELKVDESEVYTKTGQYRQNKHIIEQREMLSQLTRRGYFSQFACGFEQAKRMIDNYLSQE